MFEEIEARAYRILYEKIKSYINTLFEMSSCAIDEADRAKEKGLYTVSDYFNGYSRATNFVIRDLVAIIKGVERDTQILIDRQDKKFADCVESESPTDSSRSKQS